MKKRGLVIMLGLFALLTGCTKTQPAKTINPPELKGDVQIENVITADGSVEQIYLNELNRVSPDGNAIYSPTSSRAALQMYSYMTDDENTKQTLNETLGDKNYLRFENNDAEKFVNRVWVNNQVDVKVADELKDYIYEIDMSNSEKATREKNDYVAEQTNNFITSTPTIFTSDTLYDLMNVTYFKDIWAVEGGYNICSEKLTFNNDNGTTTEVDNFNAFVEEVYENSTCYVVKLAYKNGNMFNLIYPKDSIETVSLENLEIMENTEADLYIPEFEAENTLDLKDSILKSDNANVGMIQVAKIKVDHEGTEAAAVTELYETTAMYDPNTPEIITLKFDKPFYYYIEDTTNNDIIFIGRVSNFGE